MRRIYFSTTVAVWCLVWCASCVVGPKYVPPTANVPNSYKESEPSDLGSWKVAGPGDTVSRGKWWESFHDQELSALEEQADRSNQTIGAAAASFAEARALVRESRSQYFPTVTGGASISRSRVSAVGPYSVRTSYSEFSLPFDAAWEPDLWGRVRHSVQANQFAAQSSAADLQNVRLSQQAELAIDYYQVRTQDSLKEILDATVENYTQSLQLTKAQYKGGLGTDESVAQAEAQLESAEAQSINVSNTRAQYEHAVAVLAGKAPSEVSIKRSELPADPPQIPVSLPSTLLQRRPDIAAAERVVAQANAQIGMARAAFFPNLTLGASAGFTALGFAQWLTWPSRVWSVGTSLSETIFDAGLRRATVQQYRAAYDESVANYRQTVLAAFQEVEDNLAASRLLPEEIEKQQSAVNSANRALQEANARYKAGLDPYLNVLYAQTVLLSAQQALVNMQLQQVIAAVQLIKALGGGWDTSQLPTAKQASE